ncbi:hypothetical protein BH23ACT10_BH23ACT10_26980 [soil metagenome]
MQVLVAAEQFAGGHPATVVLDSELVVLPLADLDIGDVGLFRAQPCAFVGVASHADITTAQVIDMDLSPHIVLDQVRESLAFSGPWRDGTLTDTAARLTAEALSIAAQFPLWTIVVKDGPVLHAWIPCADTGGRRRPVCEPGLGPQPSW